MFDGNGFGGIDTLQLEMKQFEKFDFPFITKEAAEEYAASEEKEFVIMQENAYFYIWHRAR